jgi:hypothetical protein
LLLRPATPQAFPQNGAMFAPIPIALVVSLVLALIWWCTRAKRWRVLATVWALYAGYEYLM